MVHAILQRDAADELAEFDDEGEFDMGDVLAGIRGKAARAVIQRDMKRKQQARASQQAWQRYEVRAAALHIAVIQQANQA